MPATFEDFPEETLVNICELALETSCANRRLFKDLYRAPGALFYLRTTCRRLHRIVTPYAFKNLTFKLRYKSMTPEECAFVGLYHTRPYSDLDFLSWNTSLASHIHVLNLDFCSRREDFAVAQETLARLIPMLTRLRAFCINDIEVLTPVTTRTLLSNRSLRILDIGRAENPELGGFYDINLDGLDMSHIKALNVSRVHYPRPIFSKFNGLEVFSIEGTIPEGDYLAYAKLENIRELIVDDAEIERDWNSIHNMITRSDKNSSLACLRELSITTSHGAGRAIPPSIPSIVDSFRSAPIQKLILNNKCIYDNLDNLSLIIDAFPMLEELVLLQGPLYVSWPSNYDQMITAFKRARNLKTLEWNILPVHSVQSFTLQAHTATISSTSPPLGRVQIRSLHIPDFPNCLDPYIETLASYCNTLRTIKYTATLDKEFLAYIISRNKDGSYTGYDRCQMHLGSSGCPGSLKRGRESMRTTSSWDAWLSPYL